MVAYDSVQARFRPTFHFHPAEQCGPVSVEAYQAGAALIPPGKASDAYPMYTHMRTVTVNGTEYIDLLYMVMYPFNFGPKIIMKRFGDHTADLEHVRILMDPVSLCIECVYFGAHSGGTWKHRDECMIDGDTLNVYVARQVCPIL